MLHLRVDAIVFLLYLWTIFMHSCVLFLTQPHTRKALGDADIRCQLKNDCPS